MGIAVIWNKKRRLKTTTTKPKRAAKLCSDTTACGPRDHRSSKIHTFTVVAVDTRWPKTGTDALGAFTHHTKKNHTPNLRCFFLRPTTTTANDGHVAINRSKLARAFSCRERSPLFVGKKDGSDGESGTRAGNGSRRGVTTHTHADTKHSNWPRKRGNPRNLRSPHTLATHADWLNDQDGECTRRGRRALCLAGELCCCRCRIWPLRIDE